MQGGILPLPLLTNVLFMAQLRVSKVIYIDRRAEKELRKFPRLVQLKFQALFEILQQEGKLEEPFGKKLSGTINLFEIRVKYQGQWRVLYSYMYKDSIVVLAAFAKKTQKTPSAELRKAKKRLLDY
ncbi:MAG TPA: type II toxin-antitoxin system RelE/ParE family toxin [Patescibacteria group bacterium]|nr:type II toxin-antitoxin system RelE/ParE family toxin [Patescibacteria group bacterium]